MAALVLLLGAARTALIDRRVLEARNHRRVDDGALHDQPLALGDARLVRRSLGRTPVLQALLFRGEPTTVPTTLPTLEGAVGEGERDFVRHVGTLAHGCVIFLA